MEKLHLVSKIQMTSELYISNFAINIHLMFLNEQLLKKMR